MKKKHDKIILDLTYRADNEDAVKAILDNAEINNFRFEIADKKTIILNTDVGESTPLHLQFSNKQDEDCMKFLSSLKDISKLQPEYMLSKDRINISFFITRLSDEEIDKELFKNKGLGLSDIDSKVLIGLFLDNRFHG